MDRPPTQSNIALAFIGTASMIFIVGQSGPVKLLPSKSYKYEFQQRQEDMSYLLKHEKMPVPFQTPYMEPLVDMPVIKKIKVKFNSPVRLEFSSVEDNQGFIG